MTSSPLTVNTTSSNFEFSFDGTTWYTTAQTYAFTLPGFSSVPIYVRFTPSAVSFIQWQYHLLRRRPDIVPSTYQFRVTGAAACAATPTPGTASYYTGSRWRMLRHFTLKPHRHNGSGRPHLSSGSRQQLRQPQDLRT
jgi:hypothetical protein